MSAAGHAAGAAWRRRQVLVTGSSGFLGGWLVGELRGRGAHVVGLERDQRAPAPVRQPMRPDIVVRGGIEDHDLLVRTLNEYEIDSVFHLAAQPIVGIAIRNPLSTFEANIRGTWNLLEACRAVATVRRIVLASSDKAYGPAARLPYDESMPMQGGDPYSVSKSCADLIAQAYHGTYGTPVCITRCANFFGGGDLNFSRIVPGTIRHILRGEAPVLRSDGTMVRDYIYVRDVAEATMALADAMEDPAIHGRAYNFSLERPMSVLALTGLLLRLMRREDLQPVILGEPGNEVQEQYLSAARARRELGWTPRRSLEEGLRETIAWYAEHFAAQP